MSLVEFAEKLYPDGLMTWQRETLRQYENANGSRTGIKDGSRGKMLLKIVESYERENGVINDEAIIKLPDGSRTEQMSIFDYI